MQAVTPLNVPGNTLNFYPIQGEWEMAKIPFTASVAIPDGYAVGAVVTASNPTGNASTMPATQATGQNFIGILAERISATDADYAVAGKLKQVWVPAKINARAKFLTTTGTLGDTDVNRICAFTAGGAGLAVDTNGAGAQILSVITTGTSGTGICSFNVPLVTTA